MVNLRMLAIAAAMLFGIPVTVSAFHDPSDPGLHVPGGALVDEQHMIKGVIDEVTLLELPPPVSGRSAQFNNETLLEGHTVFVTIDIRIWRNVTQSNVTAVGNVSCGFDTGADFQNGPLGIPIPRKTRETTVECRDGEQVILRPDPFIDPQLQNSGMFPTGEAWEFEAPSGEIGQVTEWMFDSSAFNESTGGYDTARLYAWSAPVLEGWTHDDGTTKRFMIPVPEAKLWSQPVEQYHVVFGKDVGIE